MKFSPTSLDSPNASARGAVRGGPKGSHQLQSASRHGIYTAAYDTGARPSHVVTNGTSDLAWDDVEDLWTSNWYGPCAGGWCASILPPAAMTAQQDHSFHSAQSQYSSAPISRSASTPTFGGFAAQAAAGQLSAPAPHSPPPKQQQRHAEFVAIPGPALGPPGGMSPIRALSPFAAAPVQLLASPAAASAAVAAPQIAKQSQEADEKNGMLPALGTWANRQYRLLEPVPERGAREGSGAGPSSGSASASRHSHSGASQAPAPASSTDPATGSRPPSGAGSSATQASPVRIVGSGPLSSPGHHHHHQQHGGCFLDDAAAQDAAWRWRFTRRWHAEQARIAAGETDGGAAGDANAADKMEEALEYLQATGTDGQCGLQIANLSIHGGRTQRAVSGDGLALGMDGASLVSGGGPLGRAPSTLEGSLVLAGGLMLDEALSGGLGSGSFSTGRPKLLGRAYSGEGRDEPLAASRAVASLNRRAAAALAQQVDIEKEAEQRVQESLCQGPPWVGNFLETVDVDEWGSFKFLLLKVRDGGGGGFNSGWGERQRILLRGHNYMSEGQLVEDVNRRVLAIAQRNNVPFAPLSVMGGGVMEWRRDRDRHLALHSGFVTDRAAAAGWAGGGGGASRGPSCPLDLLNLASVLARQRFPPNYRITVMA